MKRIGMLFFIALTIFVLSACQPTPEKMVVQGKDLDKMIENATKEQEGGAQGKTISERIGAPTTYAKELVDAKGKVKIHVNADVHIPEATGVSVQRVSKDSFTQAQADVLMDRLMKGEAFSGDDFKLTKSEIQQQILEIEAANIQEPANTDNGAVSGKGGMKGAILEQLKEQLATAPETSERIPSTGKLSPMEPDIYYGSGNKLYALAQSDKGGYESLRVLNYDDSAVRLIEYTSEKNGFSSNMGYFWTKEAVEQKSYTDVGPIAGMEDVTILKEDAEAQAEALIDALGAENMTCIVADKMYGGGYEMTADQSEYLNPRKCVWFFRYTRAVNGIPLTYTPYDCIKVENDTQSAPWAYEEMTFAIDDSGVVGFTWRSPYKVTDTVTENSNILSFDEVMDVFNTMSLVVHAWDGMVKDSPALTAVEFHVTEIRFGLTRVTEQDKRDSGLLIPVWDFIGSYTYHTDRNGQTNASVVDDNVPILTVNAIDGTIIDRNLGY